MMAFEPPLDRSLLTYTQRLDAEKVRYRDSKAWHGYVRDDDIGALGPTFSTFQLELLRLLDQGAVATGLGYAGASLALGFVLAWAGVHLTRTRRSTPGEAGG
jgi:fluoride ion exporter CrcB/FEX